jgi:hypothetical protein
MHIIEVSLSNFLEAAGADHHIAVVRLWEDPNLTHLVLFSDRRGGDVAILPVGAEAEFKDLTSAAKFEHEGLQARISVRTRSGELQSHKQDLAQLEVSLRARERYVVDCESKLAALSQNMVLREAQIEHREQALIERQRKYLNQVDVPAISQALGPRRLANTPE